MLVPPLRRRRGGDAPDRAALAPDRTVPAGDRRRRRASPTAAPAYTYEQPLRRSRPRAAGEPTAAATWEVASLEPGLDLAAGAPAGWTPQSDAAPASIPWGRLPHPFVFRTTGPALGPAPVDIAGFTIDAGAGGRRAHADRRAAPRRPGGVVRAARQADAGAIQPSRRAAARPLDRHRSSRRQPDGIAVARQLSPRSTPTGCATSCVAVTDPAFPAAPGWQRLPAVAAAGARGLDRRRHLGRPPPARSGRLSRPAITLNYVTVTSFNVMRRRTASECSAS